MPVLQGYEAFESGDGPVGVLLCHGFTGSPASLRPWARDLVDAGHRVSVPLLPGHGTSWRDLDSTSWPQWYDAVERALEDLRARCRHVVVGGLSMGGALALRLAALGHADVAGVVLVNPAVVLRDPRLLLLPALKHVVRSTPGIGSDIKRSGVVEPAYPRTPLRAAHSMLGLLRDTVRRLPEVTQPVLLFRSATDHVVPAASSALVLRRIRSRDVTSVVCDHSYHVATLDNDAPMIFARTRAFVERVAPVSVASGGGA